jgi:hypothetical protein
MKSQSPDSLIGGFETNPMNRCGAQTRVGTLCRRHPVPGRTRCRLHGGDSTGPHEPSTVHGVYRQRLTAEEQQVLLRLCDGDLREEVGLARVQVLRLLEVGPVPWGDGRWTDMETWFVATDRALGRLGRVVEQRARVEEVRELAKKLEQLSQRLESTEP